jgi:hypothetical protein
VAGELFRKAAELRQQLDSDATVYCTVSVEDLKGYSEACDITSPTVSAHNLTYQLHRAIRDQYTVSTMILIVIYLRIMLFLVKLYQTTQLFDIVSPYSVSIG